MNRRNWKPVVAGFVFGLAAYGQPATAGVSSRAVQEAVELVTKKFAREAGEQGAETLTRKVGALAAQHGDDALRAVQNVGPRVPGLVESAGSHADLAVKLLARRGDDAVGLVARPQQLQLVAKLGDDAAEALMKHGPAVEPLLEQCGPAAAKALTGLTEQNGRRAAMLLADGDLTRLGQADELLGVMQKYGDAGAEFIWTHRKSLTLATGLTAFLATPETFINGATDLADTVAEAAVQPVVTSAANSFPWAFSFIALGIGAGAAYWIARLPKTSRELIVFSLAKVAGRFPGFKREESE